MKRYIPLPRIKKSIFASEHLLAVLFLASVSQIATCFSAGRVLLAPASHLLPEGYGTTLGTNVVPMLPHHSATAARS